MNKRYVSFSLAGGRYCIPVDQVLQILRLENLMEIPKAPPYVEGVVNLRGDIIPVVGLRQRLEIQREDRREPDPRKRRIIIVRVGTRSYGLDVDEVREIVEIDDSSVATDATTVLGVRAEFVTGIARRDDSMYILLDLPRVFSAGRDLSAQLPGQS